MSAKLPRTLTQPTETRVPDSSPCNQALLDQAIAWLLRVREVPNDGDIQRAFSDWLAADPSHRLAYRQAEAQWAWLEQFKGASFPAREEALRYRPKAGPAVWRKPAAFSAAAALLLGIGLGLFSPQGWYGLPHSYSVAKGQRQTVALPDGSSLEMNTDTEVRVRFNRGQRRVELLRGEAFFNVVHDAKRPFNVRVGDVGIYDIGTAFDVYKQPDRVSVTVLEGEVELDNRTERRPLTAGQQLSIGNDLRFAAVEQTDIAAATAWRQGLLVFRGRPLAEVLAEIGRYHEVRIRLPDPKLAELRVNGSFRTGQLDNMLNAVATLLPIAVKHVGEREIVLEAVAPAGVRPRHNKP